MKREIKFRVWDSMYLNWKNPEDYTYTELFLDDRYIVQQYTGMVDFQAKEIYEGDVIKYKHPKFKMIRTDEVKFISGCFVPDIWRTTVDTCEVIGNIFENPEFLK